MPESSHLARPYARAVFELAQAQGEFAPWADALDNLAAVVADDAVAAMLRNPRVGADEAADAVVAVVAKSAGAESESVDAELANLIKLLANNRRLPCAPDIARLFAALRAEAESVIEARMTTAAEIDAARREQFADALRRKLGRKVNLEFAVDESLLGGAVVRAGDLVIDGSARAQLNQLAGALSA